MARSRYPHSAILLVQNTVSKKLQDMKNMAEFMRDQTQQIRDEAELMAEIARQQRREALQMWEKYQQM